MKFPAGLALLIALPVFSSASGGQKPYRESCLVALSTIEEASHHIRVEPNTRRKVHLAATLLRLTDIPFKMKRTWRWLHPYLELNDPGLDQHILFPKEPQSSRFKITNFHERPQPGVRVVFGPLVKPKTMGGFEEWRYSLYDPVDHILYLNTEDFIGVVQAFPKEVEIGGVQLYFKDLVVIPNHRKEDPSEFQTTAFSRHRGPSPEEEFLGGVREVTDFLNPSK